ncbi:MAG: ribose 5-phosphate isomerase B [Sandaracinaceae bacterium]|nr:ribose 5-phosphate isomerase B [Sandaracinaceae bacterium]
MKIAFGCDHAGFPLKAEVLAALEALGHEVVDLGAANATDSVDYPDFAHAVAARVSSGEAALGVLVCGSGVGMSIAANRHAGIRAVVCSESYSATMARLHNDANVLCFGARIVGPGVARLLLESFVSTRFEGGRHARRVAKIEP